MKVIYSDFDGIARTNGKDIEINRKYRATQAEKLFIFHEEGHILLDHFKRQKHRDTGLWNVAADLEIAIYLYPLQEYKSQQGSDYKTLNDAIQQLDEFKGLIYWKDPEYQAMGIEDFHIAEDIYEILKEQYTEEPEDNESQGEGSSSNNDNNSDNSNESNDSDNSNSGDTSSKGKSPVKELIEKAIENSAKVHGDHEFREDPEEQESENCDSGVSKEEEDDALEKINDAIASCQAAKEVKVKKLKINSAITNCVNITGRGTLGFQKTYSRPCRSKVGLHNDRIYRGERVVETQSEIFLFVDRSGSFDDEKTKEQEQVVIDLTRKFRNRLKVKTLYFTTDVFEDKESIKGYGTNVYSCFQYIEKYQPAMSIIITDDDNVSGYKALNLKKAKVGFIFVGCEKNDPVTSMVEKFNGTLINKVN